MFAEFLKKSTGRVNIIAEPDLFLLDFSFHLTTSDFFGMREYKKKSTSGVCLCKLQSSMFVIWMRILLSSSNKSPIVFSIAARWNCLGITIWKQIQANQCNWIWCLNSNNILSNYKTDKLLVEQVKRRKVISQRIKVLWFNKVHCSR